MESFVCLVIACFLITVAARPASIRSVCTHMLQASTEDNYSCRTERSTEASRPTIVLTSKLAPNARTLTIYEWKDEYKLIVEEAVEKNINLIGEVNCHQMIVISKHSSVSQCEVEQTTDRTAAQTMGKTTQHATHREIQQATDRETQQATDKATDRTTQQATDRTTQQATDRATQQAMDRTTQQATYRETQQSPPISYWDLMVIAFTALAECLQTLIAVWLAIQNREMAGRGENERREHERREHERRENETRENERRGNERRENERRENERNVNLRHPYNLRPRRNLNL